jgi:hypothetical protein
VSLVSLRDGALAAIQAALPPNVNLEAHGGRFDLEELKRMAAKAPCVRLAVLGVDDAQQTRSGEAELLARLGAFVVAKAAPGLTRDRAALAIVDTILGVVPGNRFSLDATQPAGDVRADNLYSGDVDQAGVAMWAVSWHQKVFEGGVDTSTLAVFQTLDAKYPLTDGTSTTPVAENVQTGLGG